MLLRPGSHLTDSGRPTPCSPSWRACDYADKPRWENQRSIANDGAPQIRRGIIRRSALSGRKDSKKGHLAPEKLTVLQDAEWRQSRRSVHEPDPYLRVERSQSVRLPH